MSLLLPDVPGTVLFDLDGTILDSSRPVLAAWATAFGGMGLPPLPEAELHRVIGPPMAAVAPELLAERGRVDDAAYDELVARFEVAIAEVEVTQALAYDGMVDLVEALHDAGRRLAIVTSKPMESAIRVVPALGIADLFVHLEAPPRSAREGKVATMARAVETLDVDPADTAMVGDRHHDVDAATAHGLATIGVTWAVHASVEELRAAGAAALVATPTDLAAALGLD